MPLPIPLIVAGLAALGGGGYLWNEDRKRKAGVPPQGTNTPARQVIYETAMSSSNDPQKLAQLANAYQEQGLPKQAADLQAKANNMVLTNPDLPRPTYVNPPIYQPPTTAMLSVIEIQRLLNRLGASPRLDEDNGMGPMTMAAIRAFQALHGLDVDGIVGPMTNAAMRALMSDPVAAAAAAASSVIQGGGAALPAVTPGRPAVVTTNSAGAAGRLNCRALPSADAPVLGMFAKGATVMVTGEAKNGFFPVIGTGEVTGASASSGPQGPLVGFSSATYLR